MTINPFTNSNPRYTSLTASISGATGNVDLGGGTATFNRRQRADDVDLDVAVPIINGGLTKNGAGDDAAQRQQHVCRRCHGQRAACSATTIRRVSGLLAASP